MICHGGVRPRGTDGKQGERRGDKGPEPGLGRALFHGSFVGSHHGLARQCLTELLVDGTPSGGGLDLEFHDPTGRTGLVQDLGEEQSDPTFGLFETAHEHGRKGDQLRSGLGLRNTR